LEYKTENDYKNSKVYYLLLLPFEITNGMGSLIVLWLARRKLLFLSHKVSVRIRHVVIICTVAVPPPPPPPPPPPLFFYPFPL